MMLLWLRDRSARLAWEARRGYRRAALRLGIPALALVIAAASLLSALWARDHERAHWLRAAATLSPPADGRRVAAAVIEPDARARLVAFHEHLPPHDEIPAVLQDLFELARAQGLVLARGTYRAQAEPQGGYLRYHMTFPVTGPADVVQRFMMSALQAEPTLSLESVQFRRERRDTAIVEARIQWALLTRLPSQASPAQARARPAP